MSLTAEPTADASGSATPDRASPQATPRNCPHCGAPLADDQEWCLRCGTATTLIHTTPSLWVPIAVVALVVAVAVAGFFFALDRVSNNPAPRITNAPARTASNGSARTASNGSASTASNAPVSTASSSTTGLTAISEWPSGLPGWTVVLAHTHREVLAYAMATSLARSGVAAGVIYSSQHPGWIPGFWAVFSGRYSTQAAAKAAAATLVADGHAGAHARLVER